MIISVPNYRYIRYFYESVTNRKVFKTTSTYLTTTKQVAGWITQSGLNIIDLKYSKQDRFGWIQEVTLGLLSKFFSPNPFHGREVTNLGEIYVTVSYESNRLQSCSLEETEKWHQVILRQYQL